MLTLKPVGQKQGLPAVAAESLPLCNKRHVRDMTVTPLQTGPVC